MDVRYRYALDGTGRPVDAFGLTRAQINPEQTFWCVACTGELIAKLGDIKTKHFAHKSLTSGCAYETYLHQLAKRVFYDEYSRCLESKQPFTLIRTETISCNHYEKKYGYTCVHKQPTPYDMTSFFDKVSLEKHYNGFVADVLLHSSQSGEALLVEFAVTHKCEDQKIKSGNRILEYSLENERDLEPVKTHTLRDSDVRIVLHNFRSQTKTTSLCQGNCEERVNVFVVYDSGKSVIFEHDPQQDLDKRLKGRIRHREIVGKATGGHEEKVQLFRQKVREAHFKKVPLRNCFICRYHGGDGIENAVFCKIHKQSVGSNRAVECDKYLPMRSMAECAARDKQNMEFALKKQLRTLLEPKIQWTTK